MKIINPESLPKPVGYNHAIRAGSLIFISGQIGYDHTGKVRTKNFAAQFQRTIENILTVIKKAGSKPEKIVKLTIFVKDKKEYVKSRRKIKDIYQNLMGRYYPSVTLVVVKDLLEKNAQVEIDAIAST